MATLNIGSISAVALFRAKVSRREREAALSRFESTEDEDEPYLRDEVAEQFASLCDFAVQRVSREHRSGVNTLRVEIGYGYAEHRKDWFRFGCELMVEEEEVNGAIEFLRDPVIACDLDFHLENVTAEFIEKNLALAIFEELSCSFYLLEKPEIA